MSYLRPNDASIRDAGTLVASIFDLARHAHDNGQTEAAMVLLNTAKLLEVALPPMVSRSS